LKLIQIHILKLQLNLRGSSPAAAQSFVRPKDWSKRRPTLARLLTQVPGAEQMNAGRAKLAGAQTGCPAGSAAIHPAPAMSLNGVKVKSLILTPSSLLSFSGVLELTTTSCRQVALKQDAPG
jgi:hypothetical protein